MKVMVFSHMHPQEDIDGTILCAYHHALCLAKKGVETVLIGGRKHTGKQHAEMLEKIPGSPLTEFLIDIHAPATFSRTGLGWRVLHDRLDACIKEFAPDILHFHTIMPFGFEFINSGKHKAKRVLTLHNYTPLCANDACIHADDGTPCNMANASQCKRCFPQLSEEVFRNHRQLILENLEQLDMLTTPGNFAKSIYMAAGIQAKKIRIIRNGTPIRPNTLAPRQRDGILRLAYIGRNSSIKGLNILLQALLLLPHKIRAEKKVRLSIFGPLNENDQPTFYNVLSSEYVQQVFSLLRPLKDIVTMQGKFNNDELPRLLHEIDCLVMPSLWWEVTPNVIQEAFACHRPVLCSDIGGMAEMVTDGIDGLHFELGNPHDLKDKILSLLDNGNLLSELTTNTPPPPSIDEMTKNYISLYNELLNTRLKVA
ncbi:MAG: glycosyltransferase [Azoarcus sp.]|jgi:glycosyltransferase involved in cell wall biosynthesis|nr:glycosyltransferase [Azoarcus sp.]